MEVGMGISFFRALSLWMLWCIGHPILNMYQATRSESECHPDHDEEWYHACLVVAALIFAFVFLSNGLPMLMENKFSPGLAWLAIVLYVLNGLWFAAMRWHEREWDLDEYA
jgi:hypothetical protein